MSSLQSSNFDKVKNKIGRCDLSPELQKYILTDEDRQKIDSLSGGEMTASKLTNSLTLVNNGTTIKFDGSQPITVDISSIVQKSKSQFPTVGNENMLYIDKDTGVIYAYSVDKGDYYIVSYGDNINIISGNKE